MSWKIAGVIVGGVLILVTAGYLALRSNDSNVSARMHENARVLKSDIDHRFPVGASKSEVVDYLRKQPGRFHSAMVGEYWISIGQQPSGVPYCGPMEVGIVAEFKDDRLVKTRISTWGMNCL